MCDGNCKGDCKSEVKDDFEGIELDQLDIAEKVALLMGILLDELILDYNDLGLQCNIEARKVASSLLATLMG